MMGMYETCAKCGCMLLPGEYNICDDCERKEIEQHETNLNIKKKKLEEIFYNLDDYEIKALEEFIHDLGKQYKVKDIKKQIKILENKLEEEEE